MLDLSELTEMELDEFEERAAIMQFDARMSRELAEEIALDRILERRKNV